MNNINLSLKQQLENDYVMTDSTLKTVKDLGFRYYKKMNYDNEKLYYIYSFPIEKYNNTSIMLCDIIVEIDNGLFSIDVHNFDNKMFTPFYNTEFIYPYEELLKKYKKAITNEFKKLGIERR